MLLTLSTENIQEEKGVGKERDGSVMMQECGVELALKVRRSLKSASHFAKDADVRATQNVNTIHKGI